MAETLDVQIPWPGWHAVRRLGHGSYGSVWEIERDQLGTKTRAALKVISVPPEPDDDIYSMGYDGDTLAQTYAEQARSFAKEYQLVQGLGSHPNIVACQDMEAVRHETDPGWDIFIRMELLTPLQKWIGNRKLSDREVAKLGLDIATALAACEKKDIVHRDVKPQNIMVDDYGNFKLGDFGVARTMEGTRTATVAGTETYMAPEILKHERYGRTVDIYSLGLVMYWTLNAYRLPFLPEGRLSVNDMAKAEARKLSGDPFPRPATGSDALVSIVFKACAYRPGDRYQSAAELVKELDAFLEGRRIPAPAPNITEPVIHGGRETVTEENNWVDAGGETIGKDHGNGSTPVAVPLEAGPTVVGPSGHTPGREAKPAGKLETGAPQAHPKQSPRNEEPPEPAPPVPEPKAGAQGNEGTGISRRAFIIGGTAAAAAAFAGFAVAGQNGSTSDSTAVAGQNGSTSVSTTVSASTSGIITLPDDASGSDLWVACDYSPATSSPATQIVGTKISSFDDAIPLVLRCRDGSTLVVTEDAADQELLEEVAAWTDLRKVCFGEHYEEHDDVPYALGLRDDEGFVTTWVELADNISSDTSGSWSGVSDFSVSGNTVEVITAGGEWLSTIKGSAFAWGLTNPGGSLFSYEPAKAFPTTYGFSPDIILMQDGTCWSTYGQGDACGDAIRSWSGIVQCVDERSIYAAVGSDGTVHAATYNDENQQIVKELSGWSDIRKISCDATTFLGVTSSGGALILDKDNQLNTLDLGLSGIADAAVMGDWVVTIDGDGHVKAAQTNNLLKSLKGKD
ncbi:serine/threonine-protein kinase [Olsenella sp. kh2p3]|uniref:serine/threonine-protein kinase n=1 Tax=Olsenella sp. kh2p3 TaxID=1797112 RepID=UPI00091AE10A|nr:serine/threonine-protein kinase [Olsenella sp. kh2p3]SFX21922.1 Serine/threonine protein kinase [Olsenella sp. kh2p3]